MEANERNSHLKLTMAQMNVPSRVKVKSPGKPAPIARLTSAVDRSLLAQLDAALRDRYAAFVIFIAVGLGLLLALAAFAQSGSAQRGDRALGMLGLAPSILVYILMVHPSMHQRWLNAMKALEVLAPQAVGEARPSPSVRRGEWAALLFGSLAGLALAHRLPGADGWLRLYYEATSALAFALLATAIYGSVFRSRHLAARLRVGLKLNVFDGHLLTPFAQRGQSLTLVFVGGICLSLLFQSYESLRSIESAVVYSCLVVVALTLFFMSMWTVHVALINARDTELATVRCDLAAARQALCRARAGADTDATKDSYVLAVTLATYQRQVLEAPTWPFNPTIVGRVFASAAAPFGLYIVKLAFGVTAGL